MSKLQTLKRSGLAGLVLAAIAIIACELPIIVAFVGLGALSPTMANFRPTALMQGVGVALITAAIGVLIMLRLCGRRENRT